MQTEAILMAFLSEYREKNNETSYVADAYPGTVFKGINTNDSTARYLLKKAYDDGNPIEKVLCITSQAVRENKTTLNKTALELYMDLIQEENQKLGNQKPIEFVLIPYDYLESDPSRKPEMNNARHAQYIYERIDQRLLSSLDTKSDKKLYIDITGGPRDTVFLLVTIAKYLEFSGYSVSEAVYSNKNDGKIVSILYMFHMLQIINSMNTFVITGNAAELERTYDRLPDEFKNRDIHEALDAMVAFSHSISLGNVDGIDDQVRKVNEALNTCRQSSDQSVFSGMFETMQPLFAKKMMTNEGSVSYPRMIRWCLDNGLIQQAATLYVEKMPVIYNQQFAPVFDDFLKGVEVNTTGMSDEASMFYTSLFEKLDSAFISELIHSDEAGYWKKIGDLSAVFSKIYEKVHTSTEMNYLLNEGIRNNKREIISCTDEDTYDRILGFIQKYYSYSADKSNSRKGDPNEFISLIKKQYGKSVQLYKNGDVFAGQMSLIISGMNQNNMLLFSYFLNIPADQVELIKSDGNILAKKHKTIEDLEKKCPDLLKQSFLKAGVGEEDIQKDCQYLTTIMKYYLAVKIFRNNCNHASSNIGKQVQKIINDYKNQGIINNSYFPNDYYRIVSRLVHDGLDVSEQFSGLKTIGPQPDNEEIQVNHAETETVAPDMHPAEETDAPHLDTPVEKIEETESCEASGTQSESEASVPEQAPVVQPAEKTDVSIHENAPADAACEEAYFTVSNKIGANQYFGMMKSASGKYKFVRFQVDQGSWNKGQRIFCSISGISDNIYMCHVIS